MKIKLLALFLILTLAPNVAQANQIAKKAIKNDAVDGAKILMLNDQTFRSLNSGAAPTDLFKYNTSNLVDFLGNRLTNLGAPSVGSDAATITYVTDAITNASNIDDGTDDLTIPVWNAGISKWVQNPGGLAYDGSSFYFVNEDGNILEIYAGQGNGVDTAGGLINLNAGNANNGNAAGGSISLNGGGGIGTGNGGNITLSGGAGALQGEVSVLARQLNMNSTKIVNLTTPTAAQDAATKVYVDTKVSDTGDTLTGALYFPGSSESAPVISLTGDTNTGLYFPGFDSVALTTGGTDRFRINSSGNVGIGTTSPAVRVHVYNGDLRTETNSADSFAMQHSFNKSRAGATVQDGDELGYVSFFGHDGTTFQRGALILSSVQGTPASGSVPGSLRFYTTAVGEANVTQRMLITQGGNIGIGVEPPSAKLHVAGTGKFDSTLDMSSSQINNLAAGTASTDAVNKTQLDGVVKSALVADDGTVSNESSEWITGNCSLTASVYTCTLTGFSTTPNCVATIQGTGFGEISVNPTSSTSVDVNTANSAGVATDAAFQLICHKP